MHCGLCCDAFWATSRGLLSGLTFTRSTRSASRLYKAHVGPATIATNEIVRELMREAAMRRDHKFGLHFLLTEWDQVVDAWQLQDWEAYRDVARLGRKTRLPEAQRKVLWAIFERVATD